MWVSFIIREKDGTPLTDDQVDGINQQVRDFLAELADTWPVVIKDVKISDK